MSGFHRPTAAQARAADPRAHIWVSANAGTGKTRVLSDRVLRLMLDGADPESILCITFTKAAAVEMIERIEAALAQWAIEHDDERLSQRLEVVEGRPPDDARLARARQLYAHVLELPQGLSVMTIHSFCNSLLRRFPVEAGLPPHFESIDERTAAELVREVRVSLFADRERPELQAAIEVLASRYTDGSIAGIITSIVAKRVGIEQGFLRHGGLDGMGRAMAEAFGIKPEADPQSVLRDACAPGVMDSEALATAAQHLLASASKTNTKIGAAIVAWLEAVHDDRVRLFEQYASAFLTGKDRGRARLATKTIEDHYPASVDALFREQARLLRVKDTIKAAQYCQFSKAIAALAQSLIDGYRQAKQRRSALDFDDLIIQAAELLNRQEQRDWVLYRLDCRIDHLLVDEAQDTSPGQWEVIKPLIGELMAGAGANRTAFVVGDAKQSIYSFQGASLKNYQAVHHWMQHQAAMDDERLELSFRSTAPVLEVVDAVMAQPECASAIAGDGHQSRHESNRKSQAGEVVVWPLMPPVERMGVDEPWALPDTVAFKPSADEKLAGVIAAEVAASIERGDCLASTGLPVRPRDILILVAKRGLIQELIINQLKKRGIAVAGADRLTLTNHLAVRDLMALGAALLLPEDDLNFAALLKSPLLGLSENDLFVLAHDRGDAHLIDRLRAQAKAGVEPFATAHATFGRWRAEADFTPPFELFAKIMDDGARLAMARRLGLDCIEPIDAFLGQALTYEEGHPASLQGFMHWLSVEGTTLKRELEPARNEVRVMTVHASKGLEAPFVILADCGPRGAPAVGPVLIDPEKGLLFWRGRAETRPQIIGDLIDKQKRLEAEESLRLLYVAMTRAKDRLLIAGKQSKRSDLTHSWHALIKKSMVEQMGVEPEGQRMPWNPDDPVLTYRRGVEPEPSERGDVEPGPAQSLPDWAARQPEPEPARAGPVLPSKQRDDPERKRPAASGIDPATYGEVFHQVVELCGHRTEWSSDELLAVIDAVCPSLGDDARLMMRGELQNILQRDDLKELFSTDAKIEQTLIGKIGGVPVSARIDRYVVLDDGVSFLDIKTGRWVPNDAGCVPEPVMRQMGIYRKLLGIRYPGLKIEGSILYTAENRRISLPDNRLAPSPIEFVDG